MLHFHLVRCRLAEGEHDPHTGAATWYSFDEHSSTKLHRPFAYGMEAYTSLAFLLDAASIIGNRKMQRVIECQAYLAVSCLGVLNDVGQRFLRDTVHRHFHSSGQWRQPW